MADRPPSDLPPRTALVCCATADDGSALEVAPLRAAVDDLPADVDLVILAEGAIDSATAASLVAAGVPAATGRQGTDAVKRVDGGRLIETLDRSRLYTLRLPAVVELRSVVAVLAARRSTTCPIADLVAPGATVPVIVDRRGRVVSPGIT